MVLSGWMSEWRSVLARDWADVRRYSFLSTRRLPWSRNWRDRQAPVVSCGYDLDAVDLGVVLDGGELDRDGPGAAGRGGELLDDRDVLPSGRGEDVEVGQ